MAGPSSAENDNLAGVPGSEPLVRTFPDGTLRALVKGGNPADPGDWKIIGQGAVEKYSGAGLPPGYVRGSDGIVYAQDSTVGTGLRPATQAELAALNALPQGPVARFGFDVMGGHVFRTNDLTGTREDLGPVPGYAKYEIDRNGDMLGITAGGDAQLVRRGIDYPKIDPAVERQDKIDAANQSQAGMDRRTAVTEQGMNDREYLSQNEQNRRSALQAQSNGFTSIANSVAPLGRLALDNAAFVRDTYSKPSDFLHASQLTRGVAPANPMRTQADSINQLSNSIAGFNTALQGFTTTPVAGFSTSTAPMARIPVAPQPVVTVGSAPAVYSPQTPGDGGSFSANVATPIAPTREQANASMKAANVPSWVPGFAVGGVTREPMFKVGENPDGSMNDTSEVIANPTNAPIGVISNAQLNGETKKPNQPTADDMEAEQEQKKAAAIGKVMQFVDDPKILHALVDEMDDHKKKSGKKMPGFASGTGFGFTGNSLYDTLGNDRQSGGNSWLTHAYSSPQEKQGFVDYYTSKTGTSPVYGLSQQDAAANGFSYAGGDFADQQRKQQGFAFPSVPQIPGVAGTTQAQLQADEQAARPPAITSILNGQRPTPLNLGFSLPTPGLLNALTDREKEAFGTTLAVQYNLSPSDVEAAIRQRFSGTGARSARF